MPHPVVWTPPALQDLERLLDFLQQRDAPAAIRGFKAIRAGIRQLASFPALGRPMDDAPAGFRELLVPFGRAAYVILYHFESGPVTVLALRHSRESGYP